MQTKVVCPDRAFRDLSGTVKFGFIGCFNTELDVRENYKPPGRKQQ